MKGIPRMGCVVGLAATEGGVSVQSRFTQWTKNAPIPTTTLIPAPIHTAAALS
jgi:hypothetical protein